MPPTRSNNFVNNISQEINAVDPVKIFLIVLAIFAIVVSILFYGAGFYFKYNTKKSLEEIQTIDKELSSLPLEEMIKLHEKIKTVDNTQKDKNNLSTLLLILSNSIEKYTYFTELSFVEKNGKSSLSIKGIAQSYADIIKQIDRLRSDKYKPFIKNVTLIDIANSLDKEDESVKFSLDMEIDSKFKTLALGVDDKLELNNKKPVKNTVATTTKTTNINSSGTSPFSSTSPDTTIKK